ncbi:MAG: hypothetical protein SWX82_30910, partial [Cyanobacteriota bacterium]|nr:hypothetical protein [Cyanobacteriota bacterium]
GKCHSPLLSHSLAYPYIRAIIRVSHSPTPLLPHSPTPPLPYSPTPPLPYDPTAVRANAIRPYCPTPLLLTPQLIQLH